MNFHKQVKGMANNFIQSIIGFFLYQFTLNCGLAQTASFEIGTVQLRMEKPEKARVKPPQAFFSIAWADIYGTNIPSPELEKLVNAYYSIGDKDLMIKIFLLR